MSVSYSFIVPVYNTPISDLKKCISSILLNCGDFELIIVDDGSESEIAFFLDEYASLDPRIILLHQDNKGVSAARNLGIRKASKDYLIFVDSDDFLEKEALMYFSKELAECSYDMLFFGVIDNYPKKKFKKKIWSEKIEAESKRDLILASLNKSSDYGLLNPFNIWAKVFKRSFISENNITFNESLHFWEDSLFMLEVYQRLNCGVIIDYSGYNYVFHGYSVSRTFNPGVLNDIEFVTKFYHDFVEQYYQYDEELSKACNYRLLSLVMGYGIEKYFKSELTGKSLKERAEEFKCYIRKDSERKQALSQIGVAKFPFTLYSFLIRHNLETFLFYTYCIINGIITKLFIS